MGADVTDYSCSMKNGQDREGRLMCENPVVSVYHVLRQNKVTFKAIIRLKEWGVNRRIKDMIGLNSK